ncbi:MAG: hypothetical protein HC851_15095 [Acaryochloris sp. RU_4_1]|nr:hypothetical protein [Acaryochloris sp. RU_4_1]
MQEANKQPHWRRIAVYNTEDRDSKRARAVPFNEKGESHMRTQNFCLVPTIDIDNKGAIVGHTQSLEPIVQRMKARDLGEVELGELGSIGLKKRKQEEKSTESSKKPNVGVKTSKAKKHKKRPDLGVIAGESGLQRPENVQNIIQAIEAAKEEDEQPAWNEDMTYTPRQVMLPWAEWGDGVWQAEDEVDEEARNPNQAVTARVLTQGHHRWIAYKRLGLNPLAQETFTESEVGSGQFGYEWRIFEEE